MQDMPSHAVILVLAILQLNSVELNGDARAKFEMRLTTEDAGKLENGRHAGRFERRD